MATRRLCSPSTRAGGQGSIHQIVSDELSISGTVISDVCQVETLPAGNFASTMDDNFPICESPKLWQPTLTHYGVILAMEWVFVFVLLVFFYFHSRGLFGRRPLLNTTSRM